MHIPLGYLLILHVFDSLCWTEWTLQTTQKSKVFRPSRRKLLYMQLIFDKFMRMNYTESVITFSFASHFQFRAEPVLWPSKESASCLDTRQFCWSFPDALPHDSPPTCSCTLDAFSQYFSFAEWNDSKNPYLQRCTPSHNQLFIWDKVS